MNYPVISTFVKEKGYYLYFFATRYGPRGVIGVVLPEFHYIETLADMLTGQDDDYARADRLGYLPWFPMVEGDDVDEVLGKLESRLANVGALEEHDFCNALNAICQDIQTTPLEKIDFGPWQLAPRNARKFTVLPKQVGKGTSNDD